MENKKADSRDHRGRTNSIIGNRYNEIEYNDNSINFDIDIFAVEDDIDFDEDDIVPYIHRIVTESEDFKHLNDLKESTLKNGSKSIRVHKLKKSEINELFNLMVNDKKYAIYDLFIAMSHYFDMNKMKLYDNLSNFYKKDIIKQLKIKIPNLH